MSEVRVCRDCHERIVHHPDGTWRTREGEWCVGDDLHDV